MSRRSSGVKTLTDSSDASCYFEDQECSDQDGKPNSNDIRNIAQVAVHHTRYPTLDVYPHWSRVFKRIEVVIGCMKVGWGVFCELSPVRRKDWRQYEFDTWTNKV